MLTVTDGRVTGRRSLTADGQRRPVEASGCSGWESAKWSADRGRVFLNSELTCEGGSRRVTSGVIAMLSTSEWVEVQMVDAGGYPALRALRYRPAPERIAAAAGVRGMPDRALAIETARATVAAPLSMADISEAAREMRTEALEVLLYERGGTYELDAAALVALADDGVPERVIDLVVALAYPNVFTVNSDARMVGFRPDAPTPAELADARSPRRIYDRFYDPYDPYGYGYRYGGYGYNSYSPFGWGSPYGWRYVGGPVVVIQSPDDVAAQGQTRVVKGRGYTRGATSDAGGSGSRSTSVTRDRSSGTSSAGSTSSGGSSGSSSGSGSSSSTGRTATRRGGG
jgi:hypothetical protein